ncbi:hypothetical protein ES332_D10G187300v1 [Gossypium tomentosum]|uniref:Uncharacterized protein n=1 Tax=Gossypium tomentosum TaxID=34277 RepID=A0A5D2J794_GOSTO|nr:hypothetical protein ES332_D10G187300v1 [Gossypium tomentosum]
MGCIPPYSLGPPPNRPLVGCNRITPLFPSLSITDTGRNSHSEFEAGNRESPSIPNFIFHFLPSSSPNVSQFFLFQISASSSDNGIKAPKKQDGLEGGGNSKMKGNGSISGKNMIFRADQFDLKSLDMQLEKHLS